MVKVIMQQYTPAFYAFVGIKLHDQMKYMVSLNLTIAVYYR